MRGLDIIGASKHERSSKRGPNKAFAQAFRRAMRDPNALHVVGSDELTPRERGLADSVLACVAGAHLAGLSDLEDRGKALAQEIKSQTAPPISAPGLIKRVSDLGDAIKAKCGVNPLDVPNSGQFASDEVNDWTSGRIARAGAEALARISAEMAEAGKRAAENVGWWLTWGPRIAIGGVIVVGVVFAGVVGYRVYRRW